jgi:hypothetical protein
METDADLPIFSVSDGRGAGRKIHLRVIEQSIINAITYTPILE